MVCGVVVSYYPSEKVLGNIELLRRQAGRVVVVDNTPQAHAPAILNDLERLGGCTVVRNNKNLGMAAALNIGIRHAISLGFEWIITFDQDSQIPDKYIEGMLSTYHKLSNPTQAGILCPRYEDTRLGILLHTHRAKNGDVFACMTSGSMIHAETFRLFGDMDERLFIDYVDLDYSLRLRAAGLKVIECPDAVLTHSLGRITQHKLLWKPFTTTNHSAKRRYYITRNRLIVYKRYLFKDSEWVIADFKGLIVETAKILLVEKDKLAKAGYMLRAVFDAAFGRMGKRVPL